MDILKILNTRYATKVFDAEKKVPQAEMDKLLEAIRLSASSYGLQPYKVIVVQDTLLRKELRKVAWGQPQITDASFLLVFAVKSDLNSAHVDAFIQSISATRNISIESLADYKGLLGGSVENMTPEQREIWASKQAYIALGFGLVSAAALGLDACPMEGFDPAEFDKLLKLPEIGLKSKVVLAVGYRSAEDQYQHLAKVRMKSEDFFIQK